MGNTPKESELMATRTKKIPLTAGCLIALTFAGLLASPKVSAAIRATFVEVVIPSSPYYGKITLNHAPLASSIGPGSGTLGVTNITVTNLDAVRSSVLIGALFLLLAVAAAPSSRLKLRLPLPFS